MANEIDDIVQNIVLTGDSEVTGAFEKIREAGERAFEGIASAIEHSALSFTGMAAAVAGVAAAVGIVSVGVFEFVKSTEEGISSLSDLADQAGTTTEEMSGIKAAFAAGGVAGGQLEQAFRRLSTGIQQSWSEIKAATRQSADQLKGDMLSVQTAQISLSDAQVKSNNIERDQALQRRQNANSVNDAQQRLDELNAKFLKAAGADTSGLDAVLSRQREMNELRSAELALTEAKRKKADDAANAEKEAAKAAIAAEQAQLALNQARRKEQDDQKNDINNVTDAVKKVAAGDKTALNDINASAENISKGIIKAAAESGHALGDLKGDLTDLAAPGVKDTFLEIGKVMKNIEDPALKSAIATRLLGRAIGQDFLNVLSNPEKIEEFIDRIKKLGLGVDDLDKEIGEKFRGALFGLQNDIQLVSNKLATAFGPGFTSILKSIDDALINNRQNIIGFGESIASRVVPIVESFIRVLSGVAETDDQWLVDYIDKIKSFGSALGQVVNIVTSVFSAIGSAASSTASAFNSVFGTSLNAVDVLFGAWAAAIVVHLAKVTQAAAVTAGAVEASFAGALVTLGVIGSAVFAVVKAWEAYRDIVGEVGKTAKGDIIFEGMISRLKAIGELILGLGKSLGELATGSFKESFNTMSKTLSDFGSKWKEIGEKQIEAEKVVDDVDKQVAEGQKRRQNEIIKAEREALNESITEHKKHEQEKANAHKEGTDKHLEQSKRAAEVDKHALQESKNGANELKRLQEVNDAGAGSGGRASSIGSGKGAERTDVGQSVKQGAKEGVIEGLASSEGKSVFDKKSPNVFDSETTQKQINEELSRQKAARDAAAKQVTDAIDSASRASDPRAQGGREFQLDTKDIDDGLAKLNEVGQNLKDVDPNAFKILQQLGDRSDGSLKGQAPDTVENLDRMLKNQEQIREFERIQQREFSKNLADQQKLTPQQFQDNAARTKNSYQPPVPGHYDDNGNFIPDSQKQFQQQKFGTLPASGAPNLPDFPDYKKLLRDTLPSGIPLPQSRPGGADYQQQQKTMADAVEDGAVAAAERLRSQAPLSPTTIPSGPENGPLTPLNQLPLPDKVPLAPELTPPPQTGVQDLKDAITGLPGLFESVKDGLSSFGERIKQNLENLNTPPKEEAAPQQQTSSQDSSILQSILQSIQSLVSKENAPVAPSETGQMGVRGDATEQIDSAFQTAASSIESGAQSITAALENAAASIAAAANAAAASASTVSAAGGGYIQGPGTTTSDSIPAWLSTDEYVHQAKAVKHYGVDFMHAINNMQIPRFAFGGVVNLLSPSLPRFAGGGPVASHSNSGEMKHLGTVDFTTDHGSVRVMVDRDALGSLRKAAVMKNIGRERQPSWVK